MNYDVIIVGAGASGLTVAYELARQNSQLHILVLEKEKIPGRKLNATGNGKCNLANTGFGAERLYSKRNEFVHSFVEKHSYEEVVSFFEEMGIFLYERDGYYYPVSNQAKQVTDILYSRCVKMGVEFIFQTEVTSITAKERKGDNSIFKYIVKAVKKGQELTSDKERKKEKYFEKNAEGISAVYQTKHLVLCTGGMAAPKLGGTNAGYEIAKKLSLSQEKIVPVLTPAYIKNPDLKLAKGVRLEAVISLRQNGRLIRKERGQLQINEDSISGIAMMNVSCYYNHFSKAERKECLQIDTFPFITWNELKEYIQKQSKKMPEEPIVLMLEALFPAKFGEYLLKRLGIEGKLPVARLTEKEINRMVSLIKKMSFTPEERTDFDKAQATAGGVSVDEVDVNSFECKKYPGLFITGELLDVNGECGGYNLTFAVLSGLQAAHAILS